MYSGINSVTNKPFTPREIQREQAKQTQLKLKPAAQVVLDELAKEKANVLDIRTFVLDRATTEAEVNTELLARKLYLGYLNGLEARFKNILKKGQKHEQ
jgi:hypothetical protein